MNNTGIYQCVLLFMLFTACEDVYSPQIDVPENIIVADARIIVGQAANQIKLTNSLAYSEEGWGGQPVRGAYVTIIDSDNSEISLSESNPGVFPIYFSLNKDLCYKLRIEHENNVYESEYERVLKVPEIDSIYGVEGVRVAKVSGDNNTEEIERTPGMYLSGNIASSLESPYFRFSSRKVAQALFRVEIFKNELKNYLTPEEINQYFPPEELREMEDPLQLIKFRWNSSKSIQGYNLAAPVEYSNLNIINKHAMAFLERQPKMFYGERVKGWVLILYQYSISESAYNFYKDLNSQLESEGQLFDPVYVQARNNLKCITDPNQKILGNFEISTLKEYRFYISFLNKELGYGIKEIPYFYSIPNSGEEFLKPPDFWESYFKKYPNE